MKALLCDIDGVVLRDNALLPGAESFVRWALERLRRSFLFLTNYPSQTPADLRNRFLAAGLDVPADRFFTSAMATAEFLNWQAGDQRKVYIIGEGALAHALYEAGFTITESDPDYVVVGETPAYNFEMIRKASRLIRRGARFVVTNPDVSGPEGMPSCGALAAPIERLTGRRPFTVGKPSPFIMRAALRHLQAHSEDTWIVGDNMETDIIAGIQSGMTAVLVTTGVSRREELQHYAYRPHHVLDHVGELPALLEARAGLPPAK